MDAPPRTAAADSFSLICRTTERESLRCSGLLEPACCPWSPWEWRVRATARNRRVRGPRRARARPLPARRRDDPRCNDVLATVTSHNQTGKVTRGEVVGLLSRYALPPVDEREIAYNRAVELLVNTHLLNQFLAAQRVEVPPAKIDEQIERMKEQLKREDQDLATLLRPERLLHGGPAQGDSPTKLRWSEFSKTKATDATLRKFLNENRDRFSGTQVRASHILLKRGTECQQGREGEGQAEARGDPQGDPRRHDLVRRGRQQVLRGPGERRRRRRRPRLLHARQRLRRRVHRCRVQAEEGRDLRARRDAVRLST